MKPTYEELVDLAYRFKFVKSLSILEFLRIKYGKD